MRRPLTLHALVVGLGLLLAGCDNRASPLAPGSPPPSPPVPRQPDEVPGEPWDLTITLRSIGGADVCWAGAIGRASEWPMALERSAESITIRYELNAYPADHAEYRGSVADDAFTARTSNSGGAVFSCDGRGYAYSRFDGEVSGRFTAGGSELTAAQVLTYHPLRDGEAVVTLHLEWTGRKR